MLKNRFFENVTTEDPFKEIIKPHNLCTQREIAHGHSD